MRFLRLATIIEAKEEAGTYEMTINGIPQWVAFINLGEIDGGHVVIQGTGANEPAAISNVIRKVQAMAEGLTQTIQEAFSAKQIANNRVVMAQLAKEHGLTLPDEPPTGDKPKDNN